MNVNLYAQFSQVEIIPIWDRETLVGWITSSAYGKNLEQRERWEKALNLYKRYGVDTPAQLKALIVSEQVTPEPKPLKAPAVTPEPEPVKEVKFIHAVMFAAMEKHMGGAYRLFELAKSIDTGGSGNLAIEELRTVSQEIGIRTPVFDRWFSVMLRADFAVKDKTGTRLILRSRDRVAITVGCPPDCKRFVYLQVKDLFGQGWRSKVWASFLAMYRNPISRARLEELTGVPKSTQIRYEHEAGVKVKRNYAESDIPGENIDAAIDLYEKEHVFISKSNKVCWQLANSYVVPTELSRTGKKGRTKKINQSLRAEQTRQLCGVVNVPDEPLRIYFASLKSADAAIRKRHDFSPGTAYARQDQKTLKDKRIPASIMLWDVVNTGVELQP